MSHSTSKPRLVEPAAFQLDLDPTHPVAMERDDGSPAELIPTPTDAHGRLGVPLAGGDSVSTPAITIQAESLLVLSLRVDAEASGHVEILVESTDGPEPRWNEFARLTLDALSGESNTEIALSCFAGTTLRARVRRSTAGAGAVHLQLLRIAPRHWAGRINALASYDLRMRSEIADFSGDVYEHPMYGQVPGSPLPAAPLRQVDVGGASVVEQFHDTMRQRVWMMLADLRPAQDETAYAFAQRALGTLLTSQPPNFFDRARKRRERGPMKLLSILSGAARVEEQLLDYCGTGTELTLLDVTPSLIERAAARLQASHPGVAVECLVGDINRGMPGSDRYDVILCVSALHHVANLELVLSGINARLEDDGEFWSIGEQIGRNGNRLWPDALEAANAAFSALPERLRRNAHTGVVDAAITDRDFSAICFEGIRSEELETMLEAYLIPDQVYKRNAFLWRLVDATYGDNFDLADDVDLQHLKDLVAAEAMHWVAGGRSTELHGVYRKKRIVAPG